MTNKANMFTQWIVFVMVSILLGGLLVIKFTGRQDIFSYQGVRGNTPGFGLYKSGIDSINNWLKVGSGNISSSLKDGIGFLQESYQTTKDKNLLTVLSGQIRQAQSLELVAQAQVCFDTLQHGYTAMAGIVSEYQLLLDNYQSVSSGFSAAITVLPNSATKQCLQSYSDNLKTSFESLVLVYKNIGTLSANINGLIATYSNSLGDCDAISLIIGRIDGLYTSMKEVNKVLDQVQKNLDAHDVSNYNKLCAYGTVQGLTGLQSQSRNIVKMVDELPVSQLQQVEDIGIYLDSLKEQTTTVVNSGAKNRLQNLFQKTE